MSLVTIFGCAPKTAPPPQYRDTELTLGEIITIAKGDVDSLKAVAGINIEKDDKPYSYVDASVLLKRPDWLHLRLYAFGIPVGNFIMKNGVIESAPEETGGKLPQNLKEFSSAVYHSVFWWDGLLISDCKLKIEDCAESIVMHSDETDYLIVTGSRKIRIDKSTLLPKSQEITADNKRILIIYDEPKKEGNFWYPSSVRIEAGNYRFLLNVTKVLVNPKLNENDFRVPQ